MNYAALIQHRKSVRAFREKQVPFQTLEQLKAYYRDGVQRLIPEIGTELYFFGTDAREALEGSAGYHKFLVGAPQYLVLLTENHPQAGELHGTQAEGAQQQSGNQIRGDGRQVQQFGQTGKQQSADQCGGKTNQIGFHKIPSLIQNHARTNVREPPYSSTAHPGKQEQNRTKFSRFLKEYFTPEIQM